MIEQVRDQESDAMDNIPENLQGSERYEKMENAVDKLDSALEDIEGAQESIDEAVS